MKIVLDHKRGKWSARSKPKRTTKAQLEVLALKAEVLMLRTQAEHAGTRRAEMELERDDAVERAQKAEKALELEKTQHEFVRGKRESEWEESEERRRRIQELEHQLALTKDTLMRAEAHEKRVIDRTQRALESIRNLAGITMEAVGL